MPSQTIHIPKQLYQYVLDTEGEDQSTSDRVRELAEKGKEVEEDE